MQASPLSRTASATDSCSRDSIAVPENQPIDHCVDPVRLRRIQLRQLRQIEEPAIHADPHQSMSFHAFEDIRMRAPSITHERCQHHELAAFRESQHPLHDVADGLALYRPIAARAVDDSAAGVQQSQVVMGFPK